MVLRQRTINFLILLLFLFFGGNGVSAEDDARYIMTQVATRDLGDHVRSETIMTLRSPEGDERVRRFKSFSSYKENDRLSIFFFTAPANLRDTGFLSIDYLDDGDTSDKQWLYLSAFQKTKRISGKDKSKRFMGSDFSYYDMTLINTSLFDYELKGKQEDANGTLTWEILATPKTSDTAKNIGYSSILYTVKKDPYIVVAAEYRSVHRGKIKHYEAKTIEKVDDVFFVTMAEMATYRDEELEQTTVLAVENIDLSRPISKRMYTTASLERGL